MDNHITNALLIAMCRSQDYGEGNAIQNRYYEVLPTPNFDLRPLLAKLGQGMVMVGQAMEKWGRIEEAAYQEEAWS